MLKVTKCAVCKKNKLCTNADGEFAPEYNAPFRCEVCFHADVGHSEFPDYCEYVR